MQSDDLTTTAYFREQVMRKRPYVQLEWCRKAILTQANREIQADGRIRYWVYIEEHGKFLRVVTLEDGLTLHNAFYDRNFKGDKAQ